MTIDEFEFIESLIFPFSTYYLISFELGPIIQILTSEQNLQWEKPLKFHEPIFA